MRSSRFEGQDGRTWRRAARAHGFTLIELLIALAVLLIGLLALWSLHAAAITSNANSYRLGIATTLAQDALEGLFNETLTLSSSNTDLDTATCGGVFPPASVDGLENLSCFIDGVDTRVNGLGNINVTLGPTIFLRTYHVADLSTNDHPQLMLRVRVTYEEPETGKRHGVTLGALRVGDRYNPLGV